MEAKVQQVILGFLMATIPCVSSVMMVKHMDHFNRSYKVYQYD